MSLAELEEWVDEVMLFGFPWTFNAPMTPKEFREYWGSLSYDIQLEYVYTSLNGRPFDWPARQMLRPPRKPIPLKHHMAALKVLDNLVRI